jgi:hypothetical protein
MDALQIMIAFWSLLVIGFIGLMIYRAHLTQYETDQLFLNEQGGPSSLHQENDEIIRRVNFIQPICKGVGGVTVLMTLLIIGVYAAEVIPTMHF